MQYNETINAAMRSEKGMALERSDIDTAVSGVGRFPELREDGEIVKEYCLDIVNVYFEKMDEFWIGAEEIDHKGESTSFG